MNRTYQSYLRSVEWKEKRKEFLEDAGYCCERCGEYANVVHHKHYNSIGNEERDDVEVLCKECHDNEHLDKEGDYDDDYGEY